TNAAVRMIEPTLFRRAPTPDLIDALRQLCAASNGTVRSLTNDRYLALEKHTIAAVEAAGVMVTVNGNGEPRQRAGLYSLAGTYDAIDHGLIRPGHRVLAVYTGGSGPTAPLFQPQHTAQPEDAASVVAALVPHNRTLLTEGR